MAKAKGGRPKNPGDWKRYNYFLPVELAEALADAAKAGGRKQSDCIADGIRWYLRRAANRERIKPKAK